jgi:hypothetical protein
MMMNIPEMAALAKAYWKEYHPQHYAAMVKKNLLIEEAEAAAELTRKEMDDLKSVGRTEAEAWEASRTIFIFTKPDKVWLED